MAKVVARQVVPGSQERVWHVLSDFDQTAEWLPGITSIEHTGGPLRASGREHVAHMADGAQAEQRVVAWDNSRRIAWRTVRETRDGRDVGSFHNVRTTIDLRPSGDRTEVTLTSTWSGGGPLGLIRSFGMRSKVAQDFEQALANLDGLMAGVLSGD